MLRGLVAGSRARLEKNPRRMEEVLNLPYMEASMALVEKLQADVKSKASKKTTE